MTSSRPAGSSTSRAAGTLRHSGPRSSHVFRSSSPPRAKKGVRVIYVRYTSHADGSTLSDAVRSNYLSRGEQPERMHIEGEWGWEVIDALKPQPQDLVLRKYRPDAFDGTILDSILRWNGIKTIVMVGVGV